MTILKSISFSGVSRLSQFRINKDFLLYLLVLALVALYAWIISMYFIAAIIGLILSLMFLIWGGLGCPRPFIKNKKKI